MHILMPDYSLSMPAATVPPPPSSSSSSSSLSQHVSSSSLRNHSNHHSTCTMASATTSHGHRGSAAALIADAASHAAYFHHAIARAPVSQWQKQQMRGRVRAHTTANGTLTELTSKLTTSNAVAINNATTTATSSSSMSNSHRSLSSSSMMNSLESKVPRIIWPFEQTVEDQADFASRVIYALWCNPDRPAQLPELEQVEFNVSPLFNSSASSALPSSSHGYSQQQQQQQQQQHHTTPQILTFEHRSTSSLADYLCGQPAPEDYRQFCHEILRVTQLHPSVILLALYYVYRLVFLNPEIRGAVGSEMRVWTVALALSNKYLDDHTYRASTWRQLTGLSTKELTQMEFEMLQALSWSLHITPDSFRGWSHWLVHLRKHYNDRQNQLRRQSLAMEDAMLISPTISTAPSNMTYPDVAATMFNSPLLPDTTNRISSQPSPVVLAPAPSRSKRHWRHISSEDLYAAVHGSTANNGSRISNGTSVVDYKQQQQQQPKDSWTNNVAVQRRRTSRYTCLPTAWSTQPSSVATTTTTTSSNSSGNQYSHYPLPMDITTAGNIHGKHTTTTTTPSSSSSSSSIPQPMMVERSQSSTSYPSGELIYTMATETSASMSMMRQAHDISLPPSLDMMNMSQFFPTIPHPSSSLMTTPSNLSMTLPSTTTTTATTNTATMHYGNSNHSTAMAIDNSRRISVTNGGGGGGGPLTPVEGQPIDSRLANIRTMSNTMMATRSHSTGSTKSTLYTAGANDGNTMDSQRPRHSHQHRQQQQQHHHHHHHSTPNSAQVTLNNLYASQYVAQSLMSLQSQPQPSSSSHYTTVVATAAAAATAGSRPNETMYDGALPTPLVEQVANSLTRTSSIPTPLPVISSHRMCHTQSTSSMESVPALSTDGSHSATAMISSNNNNNNNTMMMMTEDDSSSILMDTSSMYGGGRVYSSSSVAAPTTLYDGISRPSNPSMIATSSTLNSNQALSYHYPSHPVPLASSSSSLPHAQTSSSSSLSSSSSSSVHYDDRMAVTPYLYHHGQSARLSSSSSVSLASVLQHHLHSHPMTVYPQQHYHR